MPISDIMGCVVGGLFTVAFYFAAKKDVGPAEALFATTIIGAASAKAFPGLMQYLIAY